MRKLNIADYTPGCGMRIKSDTVFPVRTPDYGQKNITIPAGTVLRFDSFGGRSSGQIGLNGELYNKTYVFTKDDTGLIYGCKLDCYDDEVVPV